MNKPVLIIGGAVIVVILVGSFCLALGVSVGAAFLFGGVRGSGNIVAEARTVGQFEQVDICCGMRLELSQADDYSVEIVADDNILEEIETRVAGDTLVVEYDWALPDYRPSRQVRCIVAMPTVRGVRLSGGSALEADALESERFALSTSGGSQARIVALNGELFELDVSGGGNTSVESGAVDAQDANLSGGSHYNAPDLESRAVSVNVSGGSGATVWASESLDVQASGGSDVLYYGSPQVSQVASGGSKIRSAGAR